MTLKVAIIGAGPGGLCAAIQLRKQLGDKVEFTIYERAHEVGGTWLYNKYPGCACDVASHLYSFSFELNPNWSQSYCGQEEIFRYFQGVAKKHDLYPHIRFGSDLASARWDAAQNKWRLRFRTKLDEGVEGVSNEEEVEANILISALGVFSVPQTPTIPGMEEFKGKSFHSARWDHSVDLEGKKIAVVGTAASAVQFIPEIAPKAKTLTVFQRSPNWFAPRARFRYPNWAIWLFQYVPFVQRLYRLWIFLRSDMRIFAFYHGSWLQGLARRQAEKHITSLVPDPVMLEKVLPTYDFGCKRILFGDTFLKAMQQPKSALITSPMSKFESDAIIDADGKRHEAEVVIYATGFKPLEPFVNIELVGKGGQVVQDKSMAYLGMCINGFPNFYMLLGPNTGLGHLSVLIMIECQVNYIIKLIQHQLRAGTAAVEITHSAEVADAERIQKGLEPTVWQSGGCGSWYKDANGRNNSLWPWSVTRYWWETLSPVKSHFIGLQ
ncbi:hypothetical protein HK104_009955 [Borealophlyctis nickersoniae]|nr:hypothetical protein HK104_009955 [Borealophlyctis nickersoniae]